MCVFPIFVKLIKPQPAINSLGSPVGSPSLGTYPSYSTMLLLSLPMSRQAISHPSPGKLILLMRDPWMFSDVKVAAINDGGLVRSTDYIPGF